jgi:Na+-transporting NADH:ubiquinone oxidoreductase subunit C
MEGKMTTKTEFRETRFYPVFFMIVLSLFFIGILATFYHSTSERINTYAEIQFKSTILRLFTLPNEDVEKEFDKSISIKTKNDISYYEAKNDKGLIGYAFVINGGGLWGQINAVIAVSPDYQRIINFDIINQNETPGLGGRITEGWFKAQFADKKIIEDNKLIKFVLVAEDDESEKNEIRQVTGATSSSNAVLKIIYSEYKNILDKMEISYE